MTCRQFFSWNSERPREQIFITAEVAADIDDCHLRTGAQHITQLVGGNTPHVDTLQKAPPLKKLPEDPCREYGNCDEHQPGSHPDSVSSREFKLIGEDVSGENIGTDPE